MIGFLGAFLIFQKGKSDFVISVFSTKKITWQKHKFFNEIRKIEMQGFNIHCWIQKVDREVQCDSSINAENIWGDGFQNFHDIFENLTC